MNIAANMNVDSDVFRGFVFIFAFVLLVLAWKLGLEGIFD